MKNLINTIKKFIENIKYNRRIKNEMVIHLNYAIEFLDGIFSDRENYIEPTILYGYIESYNNIYDEFMYLQTHEKKILNFKNSRSYLIVIDFLNTYDYKKIHKFINEHNEFLAKKYIDPIREIVNPLENDRYLDEQQLLSISKRVQNNLLIAGAGSGKTTTIIGLVKLLIKCGWQHLMKYYCFHLPVQP